MSYLNVEVVSHAQRVCRLYKRCIRHKEAFILVHKPQKVLSTRYDSVIVRKQFDDNKHLDPASAKKLVAETEQKLQDKRFPQPHKFANSPGGVAYGRQAYSPDWILDQWHPLEKAQYPEYFARRDVRKREFIERWEKEYGKPEPAH